MADYKLAVVISMELFAEFKENNFYFHWFVEMCSNRINSEILKNQADLPNVELQENDFKMILNELVENGYICCQRTRNKHPNDYVYRYNKNY